jgi:hypothetical protein
MHGHMNIKYLKFLMSKILDLLLVQNLVGIYIYLDITCRNKSQYYIITNL